MFNAFARREAVEKLRKSLAEHETLRQEVEQASVRLFEQRQRAVAEVVEPVESYVNRLARSPKEFDRSVREYRIEIDRFKSTVRRIETEAKRSEAIGGGAGVAGVMAGGGMAAFGPTVAMAVATTFGTASTGTAISALSGAAAANAALAWLGSGALAAGGGGMAAGHALLALAGPVGWTVGGLAVAGSGIYLHSRNGDLARKATQERLGVEVEIRSLRTASGPSRYNMRIDGLEFPARIVDLHLPVDTALRAIDVGGPRRHFVVQRAEVADAAPAHALARHRAQFVLRDVQPAPVFRRVAELDATNQFPCPGRLEHFVEGSLGVRVEVVAHQGDLRAVGVASFQQAGDLQRPVHLRTPGPGGRLPPTRQRFAEQEDRGRAGPFVLVVDTPGTVLRGRHRRAGFLDQLHRLLVHAHDGTIRIVGFLIQIQDLFHVRHEFGIGLRRDHPVLDFPLRHPVFFSVRRMVSWLIDSMIANSTTRRASRRNDQFA